MSEGAAVHQVFQIDGGYEKLDPHRFVNREAERALVRKHVETAQKKGRIDRPLVDLFGVVGQGKSWLLSFLAYQYRFSDGTQPHTGKPTFSAKVDLGKMNTRAENHLVLQSLAEQIDQQLKQAGADRSLPESLRAQLAQPDQTETAAKGLADFLVTSTQEYVPVLAFDALDKADEELLDWIEDKLVYPVVRTDQAVLLFGGRLWHRWKKFEVRRRADQRELFPFDYGRQSVQETAKLLDRLGIEGSKAVAPALYEHTYGHPLASKIIVDALLGGPPGEINMQTFADRRLEIADVVKSQVVEKRFFDELNSYGYLRPLLWVICILRKFNPTPLRHFAVEFSEGEYKDREGGFYLDAIRDMQNTTLVKWGSAARGYILNQVVRRIMAQNLAVRARDEFQRRHRAAVELNDGWIKQYPRNAVSYLLERTFHRYWELCDKGHPPKSVEILVTEFRDLLAQVQEEPDVQWDLPDMAVALQEELDNDAEFQELLPQGVYGRLQDLAVEFHKAARDSWP